MYINQGVFPFLLPPKSPGALWWRLTPSWPSQIFPTSGNMWLAGFPVSQASSSCSKVFLLMGISMTIANRTHLLGA